jgi:hypothetical protein
VQQGEEGGVDLAEVWGEGVSKNGEVRVAVGELGAVGRTLSLEEADEDTGDEDEGERRGAAVLEEDEEPFRFCE